MRRGERGGGTEEEDTLYDRMMMMPKLLRCSEMKEDREELTCRK